MVHRQPSPLVVRAVLPQCKLLTSLFSFRINDKANLAPSGGQRRSKIPVRLIGAQIYPPDYRQRRCAHSFNFSDR